MRLQLDTIVDVDVTQGEVESYLDENRERIMKIAKKDNDRTPMGLARSYLAMEKVRDHLNERDDMRMKQSKNMSMEKSL